MDLTEKMYLAKQDLISVLLKHDISYGRASEYANKYIREFVESGAWTRDALDELKSWVYGESNRHGNKYDHPLFNDISKAISQYVLTFAERARLELENESSELSEEELSSRREDLIALEEMESICSGNKECSVTDEQKELIQVLTEGLDPEKFDLDTKPPVTKEEIEQFRVLGKKFGLNEESIAQCIEIATLGISSPTAYVERIISQQNIINQRRADNLFAIRSTRSRGNFKVKERV
jgi:hypothetical protein